MASRIVSFRPLLSVAIALLSGCGGGDQVTEPPEPRATSLAVVSGNAQTGTVGQPLPAGLVVRVNDQSGNPMAGIGVSFAVAAGGGSVADASTTTGADGQASTTWTLGMTAGLNHQVRATAAGISGPVTFTATADPDVATVLSAVSGDGQDAFRGTKVSEPIVVLVRDQFANPVPGHLVEFVPLASSGTLDSAVAFTNLSGQARTGWTLSSTLGVNTAEARAAGLAGSPVTFTATAHNLSITSVSPAPLVEGQSATIIGTGFDPIPTQNVVTVSDQAASVTTATTTQLDITVPGGCMPSGAVDVTVTTGGFTSAASSTSFTAANILSMAAGEQVIVQDPNDFCFQFAATPNTETYLIGIQFVTEVASNQMPVMLTSVIDAGAAPAPPVAALPLSVQRPARQFDLNPRRARFLELLQRHRIAHLRHMARELRSFTQPSRPAQAQGAAQVPPNLMVGDPVDIRVAMEDGTCDDFTTINTVVRAVGVGSVWLEDTANPAGGFSVSDFQGFRDVFDNTVMPTNESYFGTLTDIDGNGYVAAVVTKEVNRRPGVAGFVSPKDFQAQANCAASNEGEVFYAWTPDPNGNFGDPLALDLATAVTPIIAAHETVHIIQVGIRAAAMNPLQDLWELEGQASLGEEVNGHAAQGNTTGQNYLNNVAYDFNDVRPTDWYIGAFADLFFYYGADLSGSTPVKLSGAPEDCTWLDEDINHACIGALVNGVPFSFFRWLSDQFGSNFAGGEQELQQMLVANTLSGFANIENVIGQPIETLLAQWAAMLYADDRILSDGTPAVVDPILTMTSWNMFSLFDGTLINGGSAHKLEPSGRGFFDYGATVNVRAGSTAYFLVSGAGRAATAVRARNDLDGTLPSQMQFWVVRFR